MGIARPDPTRVRSKRVRQIEGFRVESRTIGTSISYILDAENLSRTGMLLSAGNQKRVPFQENTLLELRLDTLASLLPKPVNCLGRIVRLDDAKPPLVRYGIQIIDIDPNDGEAWERCIGSLEAALPIPMEPVPSAG